LGGDVDGLDRVPFGELQGVMDMIGARESDPVPAVRPQSAHELFGLEGVHPASTILGINDLGMDLDGRFMDAQIDGIAPRNLVRMWDFQRPMGIGSGNGSRVIRDSVRRGSGTTEAGVDCSGVRSACHCGL
jgi:hypothetical protein